MTQFLSRNRATTLSIILMGFALLVMLLPNTVIADAPPGTSQGAAAYAARWEGIAKQYQARASYEAAQRVRANEAMALRWEAMGDLYTRKAAADAQRANDAMAARWKGLAELYSAQHK